MASRARDAFRPRLEPVEARCLPSGLPFGAQPNDTGEFMLGTVLVSVVLMESDPALPPHDTSAPPEDWTPAGIAAVKANVEEGLRWWVDTLDTLDALPGVPDGLLRFQIDWTYADAPVRTGYEPIARISNDFSLWMYDFLNVVGHTQTGNFSNDVRAFNHAQRVQAGADWAFTVFVANDTNDFDHQFAAGGSFERGFAFAGGQFMVVPASRPASTYAHETGHQFWALDEYLGGSSYQRHRGYYDTPNANAQGNPAPGFEQQPSSMAKGALLDAAYAGHTSPASTLAMIGWQDSDGDGLFDVLDVPFTLTGAGRYDAASGTYRFVGTSQVQTLPNRNSSGLQSAITVNRVRRAEYRLDGGPWLTAATYFDAAVDLDLTIPVPAGMATIELRTSDDVTGAASDAAQDAIPRVNEAPRFTRGADVTVAEDAGPRVIVGWATGLSPGPAAEGGQTLTFEVVQNTNRVLFAGAPHVDPDGTLRFTPAVNANGTATITLRVRDNGGTAAGGADSSLPQSFTVLVTAVNDAPTLTPAGPALPTLTGTEADNTGQLVSGLVAGRVADPDAGSAAGIAVTAATAGAGGTWQFRTAAAGAWVNFPAVSAAAPLLLATDADTAVRFVPSANSAGSPALTFRAWDGTAGGAAGTLSTVDPAGGGGTSAFSAARDTATVAVTPTATDLRAAVTGPAKAAPRATAVYSISYINRGAAPAVGAVLTAQLPAGLTYSAAGSTVGWVSRGGGKYTLALGTLAAGAARTAKLEAVVAATMPQSRRLTVTARVHHAGPEAASADNAGSGTTTVTRVDLRVAMTLASATVRPGGVLTYALSYRNVGTAAATGVVLTVQLPAGVTFSAAGSTGRWMSLGGGRYALRPGTMADGGSGPARFAVRVAATARRGAVLTIRVTVVDDGRNGADAVLSDNAVAATIRVG